MSENKKDTAGQQSVQLDSGTYEVLRGRLEKGGKELRERIEKLNDVRKNVFGAIEQKLAGTARISTENNCVPRDMISIGSNLLFGYNVHIGLRSEINLSDVFSVYDYKNQNFSPLSLDLLKNEIFEADFKQLYKYYKNTYFEKFAVIGPYLHMVFRIGKSANDFKTFKWLISNDKLKYEGNRSEHEFRFPQQFEFEWVRTSRDYHRKGKFPHVSVLDKVFIETVGGDLTIKIEDNTDTGEGIFTEPVEDKDQRLDDAEMYYADLGNIILLKIKPFKENDFRYIVYNHKIKSAKRIDAIKDSCVLLPEGHGIIFSKGYYLQTGEYKLFENELQSLKFERKITSPNGEDYLYVFYNVEYGAYILLPYNVIQQKVDNLISCHGYSIFENGELLYFYADDEPVKHHVIQIWNTPFVGSDFEPSVTSDSSLFKIGNKAIVRCMAECSEVLNLLGKDDQSYASLYPDIVSRSADILDSYFWIRQDDAFNPGLPLGEIRVAASSIIEEFEKVVRIRRNTQEQIKLQSNKTKELLDYIKKTKFDNIDLFVKTLANLRSTRGEIISLKDLRYADLELVSQLEKVITEATETLSQGCVQFLLQEKALLPYQDKIKSLKTESEKVQKVTEATVTEENIGKVSGELEMLVQIVSNLKIDDATQTARIIENISLLFSEINQIKAFVKNKKNDLRKKESAAEFNAQVNLIEQSIANYLDLSVSPEKCDEYLSRLMIQLEELEGKFSDFENFISTLIAKREEVYQAFESKRQSLLEARNNKANAFLSSAERIISGVKKKIATFNTVAEINGYFASDLMIGKLRDIVNELTNMGDNVKADSIQGKIKNTKEEALRQLKDKKDIFVHGANVVKFGNYHFSVNTQPLDLTMVLKNDKMYYHITGTGFFEEVLDEEFLGTKSYWNQVLVSESEQVYRGEYLAYLVYSEVVNGKVSFDEFIKKEDAQLVEYVQQFMGSRYSEGYVKGVNDKDAAIILNALLKLHKEIDLLKYSSVSRALGTFYWTQVLEEKEKFHLNLRIKGLGSIIKIFPSSKEFGEIKNSISSGLQNFVKNTPHFNKENIAEATNYLVEELMRGDQFVISGGANQLITAFHSFLKKKKADQDFHNSLEALHSNSVSQFELSKVWLSAFVGQEGLADKLEYLDEAALLLSFHEITGSIINVKTEITLTGLAGSHSLIAGGNYTLNFNKFVHKLYEFTKVQVPQFEKYLQRKNYLVDSFIKDLRLDEFKSQVLSSFVRNRLIDDVYLPLIGANLAKQIGVSGENKRTDQMGMLLLISPPGYGKTTLMEYIASRLGIIFMKINGPALGHKITSVDPSEAPNAAAREELEKLNLAFEMGDNVMIYVDDIQHCNPEFLQKFISLCDGQRKIEGVYKGKSKTYDFRGKKVCVVMAGNPYTESGEKFKIPDMLSNRADTYNLGDISGNKQDVFKLSYIENCLTSNAITNKVVAKSIKDIYSFIKLAETGDKTGLDFEGSYSGEEMNEVVSIVKKLVEVREIVLKVNQQYIYSASQAEEYRNEPSFKLQGSYRNMNKMAEKIVAVMNEEELKRLIMNHYQNESQTLTTGAEANLLKFKNISGWLGDADKQRWDEICSVFKKNQKFGSFKDGEHLTHLLAQLAILGEGVDGIRQALEKREKDK